MASNLKVDIVKPTATNGSLSLKGDSGGSATSNGISVNSSGNTSITGITTTSTASLNGAVTINESGADVDFRVESDTNENALFVEGSSGNVGIGTNSPLSQLHVLKTDLGSTANWFDFSDAQVSFTRRNVADQYVKILGGVYDNVSTTNIDLIAQAKDNNYDAGFRITAGCGSSAVTNNGYLSFSRIATDGSTISASEKMRIDSSGNVELTGGGDLTVSGTTTITTADINGGTIDGTTLGSTVVFPAGHVITGSTYYNQKATQYYETNSNSYVDMGLEIEITPKFSSANSFIVVDFYSGLAQDDQSSGTATINYSTSSGVTTESSSTKIVDATYPIYIGVTNALHCQLFHTSYSAGNTQYYRIFLKSSSSGSNVRLVHNNAAFSFYAYEVKK